MNIDHYKREILYRKSQGKRKLSQYQIKIESLLRRSFDELLLLSLAETDNIIAGLMAMHEVSCVRKEYLLSADAFNFVLSVVEDKKYYLLIDEDWKCCGAYMAESAASLCASFDFDETTSDEIRLISTDLSTQISIDYSETCGEKVFECCVKVYQ
ncbi:hypothetical protein C1X59_24500 [Pseudomonas sp. FW215-R2]|jgi:hypothetical protein|uniref:hypothetical protein n=1 Tax=unclassified Pseudomonas TaxID=196821 RepID=UPI000C88AC63|nr:MULTISPECIES: hypothetical protein [unclassified Pseudomonas]PMW96378.1 hypothetical protein C1X59_24500 [Pseudomonas sp. FW215-R2]PMX07271.1 hypothetical protein C1X60_21235 [Pseudomonas sp. FW215-L1]PMX20070.1 hypothetical protein C1X57_22980 [Pseudomonas sp. FW215-E1]PNA21952.1 hypothetical protein C1X58_27605 [Pseudomonas sp. FW215-R4]